MIIGQIVLKFSNCKEFCLNLCVGLIVEYYLQEYDTQVSEDLKIGSEVMRVFAYDIDDGENSRLSYNFSDHDRPFTQYFRIDRDTGVVYLKEPLTDVSQFIFILILSKIISDRSCGDSEF